MVRSAVIFLHGLGDSPAGWSSLEAQLGPALPGDVTWRFPCAPTAPVSINDGAPCASWFDILDWPISLRARDDRAGMAASVEATQAVIDELIADGVPSERIVVGGFSQGGAAALRAAFGAKQKLGACVCLSGWLFHREEFDAGANAATPVFWGHGDQDPVVLPEQQAEGAKVLAAKGVSVTAKSFGMGHSSHPQEMAELKDFLQAVLA